MRGAIQPRGPRPQLPTRLEPPNFPDSCQIALKSMSNYVTGNIDPKFKRSKLMELQTKLDSDLFGLSADSRMSFWTPMERFKLLDLICKFYMTLPTKSYEYFTLMFCGREGAGPAHDHRMGMLKSLCTLAVQYPCYLVFKDIAIWFTKLQQPQIHAKRIVDELFEDFVLPPEEYNLCKDLLPLRFHAFEFACYFIVFSITDKNMCPQLSNLVASWITEDPSEVLRFIAENPTLCSQFKDECVQSMLIYDVKKSLDDTNHDKFHCALTLTILNWTNAARKVRNDDAYHLNLAKILNDLILNSDSLRDFQRARLVQNVRNCYNSGFYPSSNVRDCIYNIENSFLARSGLLNDLIDQ